MSGQSNQYTDDPTGGPAGDPPITPSTGVRAGDRPEGTPGAGGSPSVPAAEDQPPIPTTAAVCGLSCEVCSVYIGSHEDPKRLATLAARWGWSPEEARCDGCRAERRTPYCRSCDLFACAGRRGHTFCGECEDFPCSALEEFRREAPHRAEIFENLHRINEVGVETWLAETRSRYACPTCRTLNSAYDLKCRSCGRAPGSAFVAAHREEIVERLSKL